MTTLKFSKGGTYRWLFEKNNGDDDVVTLRCVYRTDDEKKVCLTNGTNSREFVIKRTTHTWLDGRGEKHSLKVEYVTFRTRKLLVGPILVNGAPVKAGGTAQPIEARDPQLNVLPELKEHIYKREIVSPQALKSGQLLLPF